MSENIRWAINSANSGGIEGWVAVYKEPAGPDNPFALMHEDEAEEVVEVHNASIMTTAEIDRVVEHVVAICNAKC